MEVVAVIDFETTGLSPAQGDRATEIAAVILEGGKVVDRYQSLMNAGVRIPSFIESLTGISNAMIRSAPTAAFVMREASDFIGDIPLVAHNASFDCKFWDAELARINHCRRLEFACSLLLVPRQTYPGGEPIYRFVPCLGKIVSTKNDSGHYGSQETEPLPADSPRGVQASRY